MNKAIEVPQLFYSTWGVDFYSEHWLTEVNCWMLGFIKFVEANLDFTESEEVLATFEKLCASDHMFVYPDPKQQAIVKRVFLQQYQQIAEQVRFKTSEVVFSFPVDPYKSILMYVSQKAPSQPLEFNIDKLGPISDQVVSSVSLDSKTFSEAGLFVHYQYFMLQPEKRFRLSTSVSSISAVFTTPDLGMPYHMVGQEQVKFKYDHFGMRKQLEKIWGVTEVVPVSEFAPNSSQVFHTIEQAEQVLQGKKVAVFKYNKELFSLARFNHLSSFDISVVFDDKVSLADANQFCHSEFTSIPVVSDIKQIEDYDFDCIVLTCSLNYENRVGVFQCHGSARQIE